jgi:hypothetical protein
MSNFKISNVFLFPKKVQKCRQMGPRVKFAKPNSSFILSLSIFAQEVPLGCFILIFLVFFLVFE